jgi:glycerate kinase
MKNILIAPDSFKGTLTSREAGDIIQSAFMKARFDNITVLPVSDGGDGMTDAVKEALGGKTVKTEVKGPFFETIKAEYILCGKTAVIESAEACGLIRVPEDSRDPMNTTTYGVGQLISDALSKGAENIIIGLGGSATNDGGVGMACALGVKFYSDYSFIPVGRTLINIKRIDLSSLDKRLKNAHITACCDVSNPFCGKNGAAYVYAKQKGASPEEIKRLDAGLEHLADIITNTDLKTFPGSGAAGGLGGGIAAFLGGTLMKGFEVISGLLGLEKKIQETDIVITGEGKTDSQTSSGKLPAGIASICKKYSKTCILISGCIDGDISSLYDTGVTKAYATVTDIPKKLPSKREAADTLYTTALKAAKELL